MSRRGWFLFAALGLIWGTPYMFIRIAVEHLGPAVVVAGRMAIAVLLLWPAARKHDIKQVWRDSKGGIIAFACAEMVFPFGALSVAERRISSSLAGLLIAAVPLTTALLLRRINHDDQWDRRRVFGLLIGFAGVASLVGLDVRADNWWSIALCFVAVGGYALGPIIITTRLSSQPEIVVIALAQAVAAAIYSPVLAYEFATGTWKTGEAVPASAWLSVLALGALCTALAFTLLFKLIDEVGPGRTTVITYINPAVAVLLGIALLDEQFTTGIAVGFPLVLLGSLIATRKSAA
jgi:drug/metabolite transporter (DMT)-like permease